MRREHDGRGLPAGPLALLNETVLFPWEAGERAETRIEVVVRETARVAIPVIRRGPE